jgi:hypothetical protein|tara:strand:+ start:221 stop:646 length:426 start_codon:yes stop_codon:yes gene_type:complete
MISDLSDPRRTAQSEAERILSDREWALTGGLERVLDDSPLADRSALLKGLTDFHQERMSRIPDSDRFPQSGPWVEFILAVDQELQALADLSDEACALGYRAFSPRMELRKHNCLNSYHYSKKSHPYAHTDHTPSNYHNSHR